MAIRRSEYQKNMRMSCPRGTPTLQELDTWSVYSDL